MMWSINSEKAHHGVIYAQCLKLFSRATSIGAACCLLFVPLFRLVHYVFRVAFQIRDHVVDRAVIERIDGFR